VPATEAPTPQSLAARSSTTIRPKGLCALNRNSGFGLRGIVSALVPPLNARLQLSSRFKPSSQIYEDGRTKE
jgi:hypothetical protein